jgi:hypothetical protein
MTQYRNDNNNRIVDETTGLPVEHMLPHHDDEDIFARERRAFSAWNVIGAGIVIVLIATASFALWPSQTTDPTSTASTTPAAPITAEPSGSAMPPRTVEPTPDAGSSGQTQVTTPDATDKAQ